MLFFGNIAPYKGLEYLIEAFRLLMGNAANYRLIIAGKPKNCGDYWNAIKDALDRHPHRDRILQKSTFIPDAETEVYFKAADVVVLPYRHIFQSGVLSLSYSFGVPVIASDVGALRDDIVEGRTGFVCKPENPVELARMIEKYFDCELYSGLSRHRKEIQEYARQRYSWEVVSEVTQSVYEELLAKPSRERGRSAYFMLG
jgi:glycosyltransferase involved in cell wall biosynthesis